MLWMFLSSLACTNESKIVNTSPKTPNIVFITMDTTRKDHLGIYGYKKGGTETIDAFAKNGYYFTHAYSSIPLTTPAHASMLTGLYPPHHGIRSNGDAILPDELTTLPEVLQSNGFDTVASVSAFVTTKIWNLDQGFDAYFDEIGKHSGDRWAQERTADLVVDDLIAWMNQRGDTQKPFFMWAHLYDPHHPHIVHEGYEAFEDSYDSEIAYMDDQIQRLKEAMEGTQTIWVLIADHGEAFHQQHGEQSHGLFLYEETMRIPWIIQPYPTLEKSVAIDAPTSLVDVPNTILGLLGLSTLENIDGINALASQHTDPVYMESSTVQHRFGYHPEIAVVDGQNKFMPTPSPRLYDLIADPQELNNIYTNAPKWNEWTTFAHELFSAQPKFQLLAPDASAIKQLEMLGYMGGSEGTNRSLSDYDIDAKDRLSTIQKLDDLVRQRAQKDGQNQNTLIDEFYKILEKEPQLSEARLALGQLLYVTGRKDEALEVLEKAHQLNPSSVVVGLNLASQYADQGQYAKGIQILENVLQQVPNDASAQSNILRMLSDSKEHTLAIERGQKWLQENPSPQLQAILGVILVRDNQFALGEELLHASLSDGNHREHVHRSLGHIALSQQNLTAAISEYELELQYFDDDELKMNVAKMYERSNNWQEAARHNCELANAHPKSARIQLNCAQSLFNLEKYEDADIVLQQALALKPDGPFILLLAANLASKQGDPEKAKQLFAKAKEAKELLDSSKSAPIQNANQIPNPK